MYARRILCCHLKTFLDVATQKNRFSCIGTQVHRYGTVRYVHLKKKVREFPVPSRDVTTKLSLSGNNDVITELFLPRGSLVSDIPAGDGKLVNLFLRCSNCIDMEIRIWIRISKTMPILETAYCIFTFLFFRGIDCFLIIKGLFAHVS